MIIQTCQENWHVAEDNVKLFNLLLLIFTISCSSGKYNTSLKTLAGNVHNCNTIEVGEKISMNYNKCRNLELPTKDIDEVSIWYKIDSDFLK